MLSKGILQWHNPFAGISWQACSRQVLLCLFASSFAINLLSLAFPLVLLQTYDRIIPNEAVSTLILLFMGVVCAIVFEGCLRMARTMVGAWADARFEHQRTYNAFSHHLMSAKWINIARI